jgi:tetratricopeptide (TPR) repeat protein
MRGSTTLFRHLGLSRFTGAVLMLLLFNGCVSTPSKPANGTGGEQIFFVENESVDLSVRQDFNAALQLLQEQRYAEAIDLLSKVINASQNNSAPYINIAMAYRMVGDWASAEKNLKLALEVNPKHPVALNEFALLQRKNGRYDEAKQLYQEVLKVYPKFMPARKNLGILCELYLNDATCALAQYEVYLEANPDDEDVKIWIAALKK